VTVKGIGRAQFQDRVTVWRRKSVVQDGAAVAAAAAAVATVVASVASATGAASETEGDATPQPHGGLAVASGVQVKRLGGGSSNTGGVGSGDAERTASDAGAGGGSAAQDQGADPSLAAQDAVVDAASRRAASATAAPVAVGEQNNAGRTASAGSTTKVSDGATYDGGCTPTTSHGQPPAKNGGDEGSSTTGKRCADSAPGARGSVAADPDGARVVEGASELVEEQSCLADAGTKSDAAFIPAHSDVATHTAVPDESGVVEQIDAAADGGVGTSTAAPSTAATDAKSARAELDDCSSVGGSSGEFECKRPDLAEGSVDDGASGEFEHVASARGVDDSGSDVSVDGDHNEEDDDSVEYDGLFMNTECAASPYDVPKRSLGHRSSLVARRDLEVDIELLTSSTFRCQQVRKRAACVGGCVDCVCGPCSCWLV